MEMYMHASSSDDITFVYFFGENCKNICFYPVNEMGCVEVTLYRNALLSVSVY